MQAPSKIHRQKVRFKLLAIIHHGLKILPRITSLVKTAMSKKGEREIADFDVEVNG